MPLSNGKTGTVESNLQLSSTPGDRESEAGEHNEKICRWTVVL